MKLISVSTLKPGMVLAQDVFAQEDSTLIFLRKGAVLNGHTIQRLHQRGIHKVFVEPDGGMELAGTADFPILQVARNRATPVPSPITGALKTDALASLKRLFGHAVLAETSAYEATRFANRLDDVVKKLVDALVRNSGVLVNINHLKSMDEFTYHHSLSVSVLSISLGQQMGLSSRQLGQLGLSAIIHDIGKINIPSDVLYKPAVLTAAEYDIVKGHSSSGTSYLISASIGDEAMWRAVLLHHERVDGRGYPTGLAGRRIPLWSRIISVADVYDAMTSQRPHRPAMQPWEALEYIMGGAGTAFDHDIVHLLVQTVDLYPVGSCILLSNGRLALVLDNDYSSRPVVELLGTGEVVDLFRDRSYLNVVITRVVPETELARINPRMFGFRAD